MQRHDLPKDLFKHRYDLALFAGEAQILNCTQDFDSHVRLIDDSMDRLEDAVRKRVEAISALAAENAMKSTANGIGINFVTRPDGEVRLCLALGMGDPDGVVWRDVYEEIAEYTSMDLANKALDLAEDPEACAKLFEDAAAAIRQRGKSE